MTEISGLNIEEGMEVIVGENFYVNNNYTPDYPVNPAPSNPTAQPTATAAAVNPAADLKALEGFWKVVRVEKGKESQFKDARLFIIDGRACQIMDLDWEGSNSTTAYSIDPTKTPKTIDLPNFNSSGQGGESSALGIYEFDGQQLKICFSKRLRELTSDQRPKSFAIDPNSADTLYVLEREQPSADDKLLKGDWEVVSQIKDGKTLSDDPMRYSKWQFADHSLVTWQNGASPCGGKYVLDATVQPARITADAQAFSESENFYLPGRVLLV
jgi:uncharacterized protein (TIGR03067 family)